MKRELKSFFLEAISMGPILLELIGEDHKSRRLAEVMQKGIHLLDDIWMAADLELDEMEEQLEAMKETVQAYFYHMGEPHFSSSLFLNIPIKGTRFIFNLGYEEDVLVQTCHEIQLELNELVLPNFLPEYLAESTFYVSSKAKSLQYSGIIYIYFLKKYEEGIFS